MTMTIADIVDLIHADHHRQLDELLAILRCDGFPKGCAERDLIIDLEHGRNRRIAEAESYFDPRLIIISTEGWLIWTEFCYLKDEVVEWAAENLRGYWNYHCDLKVVCFENDVDAVYFKLRWHD